MTVHDYVDINVPALERMDRCETCTLGGDRAAAAMKSRRPHLAPQSAGNLAGNLEDLAALWTASAPEDLWRELVVHPGRSSTDHFRGVLLFRHHHADGVPGALMTALLLCTDRRWDRCTGRLIAGILDAAILDKQDLDELADCFLWSDRFRFEYPLSWLGTRVSVELPGGSQGKKAGRRSAGRSRVDLDPATPVPTFRSIQPPLRRWSASRVLRAEPRNYDAIEARAKELGSRDGAAVVSGILDAFGSLDRDLGRRAIDLGLGWSHGSVRRLALDRLAAIDLEAARSRAAADPDQKVRGWVARQARTEPAAAGKGTGVKRTAAKGAPGGQRFPHVGQVELFPE